ncbi:50S ribosomal protein L35 [Candidatus Wolfebacteria bacterium]|nr:50S ribosomal protein L35 [Candidatus Wolfebacteria bacterium]
MRKFISDRFKVTRTGKILRRAMAQGHFLAKKRTQQVKRKKGLRTLEVIGKKIVKRYL